MSKFSKSLAIYRRLHRQARYGLHLCPYCGNETIEGSFCSEQCEFNFYDERTANEEVSNDDENETEIILNAERESKSMPFDSLDEEIYSAEYQRESYQGKQEKT